jgi:hypothetical protein
VRYIPSEISFAMLARHVAGIFPAAMESPASRMVAFVDVIAGRLRNLPGASR